VAVTAIPKANSAFHYFCIDSELVYEPFYQDFGPLNLSCTYKYSRLLKQLLDDPALKDKKIVHYCSQDAKKRPNAAYLIGAFQVMMLRRPAEVAYKPFNNIKPPFMPFRDATMSICTYQCTVLDCLKGLEYAMRIKWFDPATFDCNAYDYYERVENGDISWVIPDKFLAFSGPSATPMDVQGYPTFTPEDYVPVFKAANVSLVVRLNKKQYDRRRFTDHGLKHVDLFFIDGSCPPTDIINKFLALSEAEPNAIAVHCKAGLGRTGTLIGLYAQKHYKFPGAAFVGWNRICRPGAILGPQQQFLCDMEREMIQWGEMERAQNGAGINPRSRMSLNGMRELQDFEKQEDVGQGDRLVAARRDGGLGSLISPSMGNTPVGGAASKLAGPGAFFANKLRSKLGNSPNVRGMFGPQPAVPGGNSNGVGVLGGRN